MKRSQLRKDIRNRIGASLVELLVASILMSFSIAVIGELMGMMVISSVKLNNQFDAHIDARTGVQLLKDDVKSASGINVNSNAKTLILQTRKFEPSNGSLEYNTLTYMLTDDTNNPNYSKLVRDVDGNATTVIKDIVGPKTSEGIKVFSYFTRKSYINGSNPNDDRSLDYIPVNRNIAGVRPIGVRFDLELRKPGGINDESANKKYEKFISVHGEVFTRVNAE